MEFENEFVLHFIDRFEAVPVVPYDSWFLDIGAKGELEGSGDDAMVRLNRWPYVGLTVSQ